MARSRAARFCAFDRHRLGVVRGLARAVLAGAVLTIAATAPFGARPAWSQQPPSAPQVRDLAPPAPQSPAALAPFSETAPERPLLDGPTSPLRVGLATIAPPAVCAPSYQVLEVRNAGDEALGDVRLSAAPPLGDGLFAFASDTVEISTDDGRSWRAIEPPVGLGTRATPYVWSSDQAPALGRLGPAGRPDDSVLLRWRAALGHAFADAPAESRRLWLSAAAVDARRAPVQAEERSVLLPVRRPSLSLSLVGRNATRGGPFGPFAAAAPGDVVEWRLSVENRGEAAAPETRVQFRAGGPAPNPPIVGLAPSGGADADSVGQGVFGLRALGAGGRKTIVFREEVGPVCGARPTRVIGSWSCDAPAAGLAEAESGIVETMLLTQPRVEDVTLGLELIGVGGRARPGNRAEVVLRIANAGAPLFAPEARIALPDGYAVDPSGPVRVFGAVGGVRAASIDAETPGAPIVRLVDGEGRSAALGPGQQAEIRFLIRRIRPLLFEEDEAQASLRFEDGCGASSETAVVAASTRPRAPALEVAVEPVGSPIVGGADEVKRFRAIIRNVGEDAARRVRLGLDLGAGWRPEPPEGCARRRRPVGGAEAEAGFGALCNLNEDLGPGRETQFEFQAVADAAALDGAPLSIAAAADGVGRRSDGSLSDEPIVRGRGEAAAIGFRLSQTLLTRDGRPRPMDQPLSLGERVALDLEARWFGAAGAVSGASIAQTLPRSLAVREWGRREGAVGLESVLPPSEGDGQARILWSLSDFDGAGRFVGRLDLEVVEPTAPELNASGAASDDGESAPEPWAAPSDRGAPEAVAIRANAVFSAAGRDFGVDAQGDPDESAATAAPPLELLVRRPDVRLALDIGDRTRDPALGGFAVFGDEVLTASVIVTNAGAAPGFFDWIELRAPGLARIERFSEDGLDNDADGRIDEEDEASIAVFESSGSRGDRLRWTSLGGVGGASIGGGGLRIGPGETVRWRLKLKISRNLPPGRAGQVALEGQFGPAPFGQQGGETRTRIAAGERLAAPPVEGFLVLSRTSLGEDLNARLAHGETVEHRLSVRIPPGRVRDARIDVMLPPAFRDVTARARLGPGLSCDAVEDPEIASAAPAPELAARGSAAPELAARGEAAGGEAALEGALEAEPAEPPAAGEEQSPERRLVWRLGDCRGALEASDGARIALLDFAAIVTDADPLADEPARADWRRPTVGARFVHRHAPEGGRPLGRSALEIGGPLLRVSAERRALDGADFSGAAEIDAADGLRATLRLENVGDAALQGVSLWLPRGGLDSAEGLDCQSVRWLGAEAIGARAVEAETMLDAGILGASDAQRLCGPALEAPGLSIGPGEAAALDLQAAVSAAARLGAEARAPVRVFARAAEAPEGAPGVRAARAALTAPIAAPPEPELVAIAERTGETFASASASEIETQAGGDGANAPEGDAVVDRERAASTPSIFVGDRYRLRARFQIPEGRAEGVSIGWRLALVGAGGPVPSEDALALGGVALARERADLTAEGDPGAINAADPGVRVALDDGAALRISDAGDGALRVLVPLDAVSVEKASARRGVDAYVLEATLSLLDAASVREGLTLEVAPEIQIEEPPATGALTLAARGEGREPTAPAIALAGPPRRVAAPPPLILGRVVEPYVDVQAFALIEQGALTVGDLAEVSLRACNRGGAPAFGVALEGALSAELASAGPGRLRLLEGGGAQEAARLAAQALGRSVQGLESRFGSVRVGEAGSFYGAPEDAGAALAPGDCLALDLPVRLWTAPRAGEAEALARVASYRARRDPTAPGRLYEGRRAARAQIPVASLGVDAPDAIDLPPEGALVGPFTVRAPAGDGEYEYRLGLAAAGAGLDWRIHRDANGDGALDDGDPIWIDGGVVAAGASMAFLAVAEREGATARGPGWRGSAVIRASAIAPDGARLDGARSVVLTQDAARTGEIVARRTMALDRDCDGDLTDEPGGGAFAPSLDAAAGECVTMRLGFENVGAAPVERVAVQDRVFAGAAYVPGSARIVSAPRGLIAKPAPQTEEARPELSFEFVGSLAPGYVGAVEYRVRLLGP